mgnify:CR=1 FL=1
MESQVLIMTKVWETNISYGVKDAETYTTKSMVTYIPISLNMERKEKTMKKDVKDSSLDVTEHMMREYPTLMNSVKTHMNECFNLMAKKQMDYGMGNIGMNGNKQLALLGVAIRLNDKIQRLLNILSKEQNANNESLVDTAQDITNYGAIFNTVLKDEWKA